MITLSDLNRLCDGETQVQFPERQPGVWFRIHETNTCHGHNCELERGEPCAGVLSLIPVNEPGLIIRNVHIGASGDYREVPA